MQSETFIKKENGISNNFNLKFFMIFLIIILEGEGSGPKKIF